MRNNLLTILFAAASLLGICDTQIAAHEISELRAPAYPLITIDPYTSAWSFENNLYDGSIKHWAATLAADKDTFEKFIESVYVFMNETTDRVPMSDWVFTDTPNQRGFQARSVVGGYFIKMLENKLRKK